MPGYSPDEKYSNQIVYRLNDDELKGQLSKDFGEPFASMKPEDQQAAVQRLRNIYDPKSDNYRFDPVKDKVFIDKYAQEIAPLFGIDYPHWRSQLEQESLGATQDPRPYWKRTSKQGAIGIGQLKPEIFEAYKQHPEARIDDPFDNMDASAAFVADLTKKYNGNQEKIIKAYHQGEGAVNREKVGPRGEDYYSKVMGFVPGFTKTAQASPGTLPPAQQQQPVAGPAATPMVGEFGDTLAPTQQADAGGESLMPDLPAPGMGEFTGSEDQTMKAGDLYHWLKPAARAKEAAKTSFINSGIDTVVGRAYDTVRIIRDQARSTGDKGMMAFADGIDETLRPDLHKQTVHNMVLKHHEEFKEAAKKLETGYSVDDVADYIGDVVGGAPAGIASFLAWYVTVPTNVKRRMDENAEMIKQGKTPPGAEKWYWIGLEEAATRAAAGLLFNSMHYISKPMKLPGAAAIGAAQSVAGQMAQSGYDTSQLNEREIGKEALALALLQATGGIRGKGLSRDKVRALGREAFPQTEHPEFWARVAPGRTGKIIQERSKEAGGKDFVRIIPADIKRPDSYYLEGGERTHPENFMGSLVDAEGTKIRDVYLTENEYNTLKGETEKPAKEGSRRNEQATQSVLQRQGLSDKYTGIATGSAPVPLRFIVEPVEVDPTTGEPSTGINLIPVDKDGNTKGRIFRVESTELAERLAAVRAEAEHLGKLGQPNDTVVAKEKAITEEAIKAARAQIRDAKAPTERLEAYERKNLGVPPKPGEKAPETPGTPEKRVPRSEEEAIEMAAEETEKTEMAEIDANTEPKPGENLPGLPAEEHPLSRYYIETHGPAVNPDMLKNHLRGFKSFYEWLRKSWNRELGDINDPKSANFQITPNDVADWLRETFAVPDPETPNEYIWRYSSSTIDKYVTGAKMVLQHSRTGARPKREANQPRQPTREAPNPTTIPYDEIFKQGGEIVPAGMRSERAVHTEKQYIDVLRDSNERVWAAEKASEEAKATGDNFQEILLEHRLKTQRALAFVGASSGLRSGDLQNMKWGNISTNKTKASEDLPGFYYMKFVENKQTRGGRKQRGEGFKDSEYPAWLNQQAYDAIMSMRQIREALFGKDAVADDAPLFTWWDGTAIPADKDNKKLNLLTRDTDAITNRPELSSYAMRHGFTTELRLAGLQPDAIEYGTGHAPKNVTGWYGTQSARLLYDAIHNKLRVNDKALVGDTSHSYRGRDRAIEVVGERNMVEPPLRGKAAKKQVGGYTDKGRKKPEHVGTAPFGDGESEGLPRVSAFRPTTDREEPGRTAREEDPYKYEREPSTPEEMRTSPLTSTHGGPMGRVEIVDFIRHKLEQVILVGKQMRKASGHYEPDSGTIRLEQAKNLSTIFHETGHAIYRHVFPEAFDPRLGLIEAPELAPWRDVLTNPQMMRSGTFQGYKRREYVQESMAEYFARYFTRPRTADGMYAEIGNPTSNPGSFDRRMYEFHRWFDQKIHDNNPALYERMQQLTELFNAYSSQSAYDRAMSNLSFGERDNEFRGNFKEVAGARWNKFMRHMVDTEWRIHQIRAKFFKEGGTFQKSSDDPLYALDAARGAPGESLMWSGHTPDAHNSVPRGIDYKPIMVAKDPFARYESEKAPIKNLYQITGMVPEHLRNDWELWMVTQAIKERERVAAVGTPNRKGRKWNHPLSPEEVSAVDSRWVGSPELQTFKDAARELYRFREGMLEYLVQTGMLERGKLELFREMYPHYVPLYRSMYAKTGQPWEARVLRVKKVGGGLDVKSDLVKYTTYKGSDLDIISPIESTLRDVFLYVAGGRRAHALSRIVGMIRQMKDWGRYVTPVQKDLKPVFVSREGIINLFRNSITWHEATTQHGETIREWIRQVRETVDSSETSTGSMPTDLSRGERLMKERITEALTARGWTPSEAEQMVVRMIDAGRRRPDETASSTERITRITREVEKIVEKTTIMEKLKAATINPPVEGKTFFYQKNGTPAGPTVITVWNKGRPSYYEVVDRELFEVITKPEMVMDTEMKSYLRTINTFAKTLRVAATSHPGFWIRNPARDMVSAFVYNKYGTVMPWDIVKGVVAAMPWSSAYKDRMLDSWRSAGGERSGMLSLDRLGTRDMMDQYQRKTMVEFFKDQNMANPLNWLKIPLEMSRRISETLENGTRLAVFDVATRYLERKGYSREDAMRMAMHQSRDTTLDYNRAGLWARQFNAMSAFYNAQVRDIEKIIRELGAERTPGGELKMKNPMAWVKAMMMITAPSIINAIMNYDDPVYQNQKWYVKDFFWYFSPPGRRQAMMEYAAKAGKPPKEWSSTQWAEFNRDHPMWIFPKPFTLGLIFGSLPERMMAHTMRELDREGSNAGDDIIRTAGKFFTAVGSEDAMHGFGRSMGTSLPGDYGAPTPTGIMPILEGALNKNFWAWRPIVPESKVSSPNVEQYAPHTSETARKMARFFDVIIGPKPGGSNRAEKGWWETVLPLNSPLMFEHYMTGYFASWGKDFLKAMDGVEKILIHDPFLREIKQRTGKDFNSLSVNEKAQYADEFQRRYRGHWQLRIPPDPTKSDTWLLGNFVPRYPSANTQAMETMFANIHRNQALKNVYMNRLIQKEWTPWRTKYEVEQLEKDHQLFRIAMADSETLSRMTSRVGQIMSIIDGLTTSPAIDLTPAERRKYIDILYFALNETAVTYNRMTDELYKKEQAEPKRKAAYP